MDSIPASCSIFVSSPLLCSTVKPSSFACWQAAASVSIKTTFSPCSWNKQPIKRPRGLQPTITAPVAAEEVIFSPFATQRAVNPWIKTVIKIVKKTKALIASPPLIPARVSKMANKEATEAETIPLGATQAINSLCRQFRSLFRVHRATLRGRTTSIKTNTVRTLPQPKAITLAIERSAASKINSTDTQRVVNWPLKRLNNRSSGTAAAFSTIPAITTAINPDSLRLNCDKPNNPQTPAKTTRFFNSKVRKLQVFIIKLNNPPPAMPIAAPMPKRRVKPVIISMGRAWLSIIVFSTTTAKIAPTGSINTPSPSKSVATRRSTATCLSKGPITVGPVTTTKEA